MDINDAALKVNEALVALGFGTAMSSHSQGCSLSVQGHPNAQLHFNFDQLGGLLTTLEFDGRPPERLNYTPTAGQAQAVAKYVTDKIAGSN